MAEPDPATAPPLTLGTRLAWGGLAVMAALALLRAMLEHDPFPWWQTDPFVFSPPVIGLTPRWALLLNTGVIASAGVMLLGLALRRQAPDMARSVLLAVGLGVIAYHAGADLESVLDASNLAAIACVLLAASCAHRIVGAQRLLGALGLSVVVLLVCIGAYEVFVVHPQTVANYEQTRDSFLAARGWSAGSFEAQAYERRLYQAEPIAWFGLTNVFASFCAASAVALGVLAMKMLADAKTRHLRTIVALGVLVALLGLVLSGAKGGMGAAVVGAGLTLLAMSPRVRSGDGRLIVGVCVLVLLGVVARGVIGERIGELSLLFRAQYMAGSVAMWLEHPIVGVGPGHFQTQYALHKPALSPEDVASAHSLPLDLLAVLGVGGVALIALLVRTMLTIDAREEPTNGPGAEMLDPRSRAQTALLIVAFAGLISLRRNMVTMNPGLISAYLIGCAAWAGMALLLIRGRVSEPAMRWAMFAGACVLAAHAMIEVTATWYVSGLLWALLVGGACTRGVRVLSRPGPALVAPVAMLALAGVLGWRWGGVNAWERELHAAAAPAVEVALIRSMFDELEHTPQPGPVLRQIAGELSRTVGRPVAPTLDATLPALNALELDARQRAITKLEKSLAARPGHTQTRVALSQQQLWVASVLGATGRETEAKAYWGRSASLFEGVQLDASGHQWAASVLRGRSRQFPDDPARDGWLDGARSHWEAALGLAPHNPHTALNLMDLALERGDQDGAQAWAIRAIELHEQSRLDPLRGLGEQDLREARSLADGQRP